MKERRRRKLIERATPLLPPGTTIRQIFGAQTRSVWLMVVFLLIGVVPGLLVWMVFNRYRIVAVTDDAIFILDSGAFSSMSPKRVLGTLPPSTPIGPATGLWTKVVAGPETLYVARAYKAELDAAAQRGGAPAALAPGAPPTAWPAGPPAGAQTMVIPAAAPPAPAPGVPPPQPMPAPAAVQLSPDRAHWWDGSRWVDCVQAAPPGAPRSPDGAYWWDGAAWRAVGAGQPPR